MGSTGNDLTGPDLRSGIAAADLADGGMLLGHADGEAVLLVRRGKEVFAMGAKCTHYGGPLAEGLLDGDTIRCPWHHACFNVRTGEALLPPALIDVDCWDVEQDDRGIRITGKRDRPATLRAGSGARGRRPVSSPASIVILGGGAAGNSAAEALRREGYDGPVTIIDPDVDAPYDRPNLSKDYLAGSAPEEWIPLHPPSFYEENEIRLDRRNAAALDARARTIRLDDGATVSFDGLLIATGAEPVRLDVPVAPDARVHYLRSLADSRALIATAEKSKSAVVIGSSFIGLEVAASLRQRELEVHVVAPESRPLERVLGPQLGDFVRALHEQHGVIFHLGRTARHIAADTVTLDNGDRIVADMAAIGVGVRPRVSLAQAAGLTVDNGIVVDDLLATSATGIYAAGDAARFPDPRTGERIRIEHWVVAERMGRVAAQNMLGARQRFTSAPFFWSQHYDVVIAYVGHAARWDTIQLDGDPAAHDCAVSYIKDGKRAALATIFRDRESLEAEVEWERAGNLR